MHSNRLGRRFGAVVAMAAAVAAAPLFAQVKAAVPRPDVRIVTAEDARLRSAESATSRQVAKLEQGDAVVVLETGKKTDKVGGVSGTWLRARTAAEAEGWLFSAWLTPAAKGGFYTQATLPSGYGYDAYLALALRRGERVRAAEDFEKVSAGELGWFFSKIDSDPPYMVVWDRDLEATPAEFALEEGVPRILEDRIYFVFAEQLEMTGETATADFAALALAWTKTRAAEFDIGARVTLGRHYAVSEDEASSNWAEEMEAFVGQGAEITELLGPDEWGRPIARVDADGGEWVWRVENMRLDAGEGGEEGGYAEDEGGIGLDDFAEVAQGEESYGLLKIGSLVVLGRHDDSGGDANWNEDMAPLVGKRAKIVELAGSDDAGFLGVRVEGNDWFWRARNLSLVGRGRAGSYGFKVGDEVILGRHRALNGDENWTEEMDAYVGMRAKIIELVAGSGDAVGCVLVRVDVDGGDWAWRAENLKPAD
ncbi:MAG: SH3 domain-containing protein [Spirochaetaceae bacterium]|nr:SH3 domain-containing protein [Spirochaetaceae bacterium]